MNEKVTKVLGLLLIFKKKGWQTGFNRAKQRAVIRSFKMYGLLWMSWNWTPLNAIVGFSEVIAHGRRMNRKNIWILSRRTIIYYDLINDILDLSRIESGRMEFKWWEHTDGRVVRRVAANASDADQEWREGDFRATRGISNDCFDSHRLRQLYSKLTSML